MRENWDLETTVLLISLAIIPVLLAIIILCLKIKSSKSNPDLYGVEVEMTLGFGEGQENHITLIMYHTI